MKTKSELLKQIGKYSAAAGAVLLTGNLANGAVNVTPASINLTPGTHGIDFDGDGLNELIVSAYTSSSFWWSYAYASLRLGSDPDASQFQIIQGGAYDTNADPAAFPVDRLIGATLSDSSYWTSGFGFNDLVWTSSGSVQGGNFEKYPNETRYAGVRFTNDGGANWYYGWIGIQLNDSPYVGSGTVGQITGFAYQDISNIAVRAGSAIPVPLVPIASAIGLGLVGLFGYYKSRRKNELVGDK